MPGDPSHVLSAARQSRSYAMTETLLRTWGPAVGAFLLLYALVGAPALLDSAPGAPFAGVVLAVALAALSAVDVRHYRLPDVLTLPLLAGGLLWSWWSDVTPVWWPAASAVLGFLLLAGIARLYRALRGRDGLGLGDAKLFAAGAAWLGAEALPTVLLWACVSALVAIAIAGARGGGISGGTRVPFGPFLAFAIWLVWLYGSL